MSGVVKIDIIESVEVLKTLLAAQKTASGKERVQALYLLKTKQVETVQHKRNNFRTEPSLQYKDGYAPTEVVDCANYCLNTEARADRC